MIAQTFARCRAEARAALIGFLTAGYPALDRTPAMVKAAIEGGADMIELGFPFSDPLADGPIIQASSQAALAGGATFDAVLDTAAACLFGAPLIAFSYFNPLFARGIERSAADLRSAGFHGAVIPDLPLEESAELRAAFARNGLAIAFLVAPTTPRERAGTIADFSTAFVYVAGRMGVTGTHSAVDASLKKRLHELRAQTEKPLAVGFGVSTAAHVRTLAHDADAVVVGSALVDASSRGENDVRELCTALRAGTARDGSQRLVRT